MPARPTPRNETGLQRPRRPKPRDFRERYLEMGWDRAIEDHYRCNWRCIRRWILEEGRDQLRADRAAAVAAQRHRQNMKRYAYRVEVASGKRLAPPQSG